MPESWDFPLNQNYIGSSSTDPSIYAAIRIKSLRKKKKSQQKKIII